MCTYIVETTPIVGSAKGQRGWMTVDSANVSYDHPYHSQFEHAVNIDFVASAGEAGDRVAVELSAGSARALIVRIEAALARGDAEHGRSR